MNYEEKILKKLVESYRKSKKDIGANIINRRTKIKPESIYGKYHDSDGDFEKISAINSSVKKLTDLRFLSVEEESYGTDIKAIYLVDDKITEIEKYLSEKYGYVSKDEQILKLTEIVNKYRNSSVICEEECEALECCIANRQIPNNINELDDILKAISFIDNNEEMLYIREVSSKVYGDSKYFENNTLVSVCGILRKYNDTKPNENELIDEVLENYNIFKEPQKYSIKGNVIIRIKGKEIDVSTFTNGIEFFASDLIYIDSVKVNASSFMTIENRTSYLRYFNGDKVVFYLGGYANRFQRDFIIKVYKDNPEIIYEHFGDIDAGGFWIHRNLCQITGIHFELFAMSVDELSNAEYASCMHKLSESDIQRLRTLYEFPEYKEVVEYMIDKDNKLEQEIVSLNLMRIQ